MDTRAVDTRAEDARAEDARAAALASYIEPSDASPLKVAK